MRWPILLAALALAAGPGEPGSAPEEIFRESFIQGRMDPDWILDASEGNTLEVEDGWLQITAFDNTFAHIERALGRDLVRVSCGIRAGGGVSWAASLFLYWGVGDWCQIGVLQEGGGKVYVTETIEGEYAEFRLSPCPADRMNRVAIELAVDGIRYYAGPGDGPWRLERAALRPSAFQGPPALLIVGKGFGRAVSAGGFDAGAPDLDNDFPDKGPKSSSWIRDVRVFETEPDRRRLTVVEKRRLSGCDFLGEEELEKQEDPSFDSLSRHYPALKYSREAIGVKDGPEEFIVMPDGSLTFNEQEAFLEIGDPPARFGSGAASCKKRLLRGYLPVVLCGWMHGGIEYETVLLGWSQGMGPDAPLFAFIRLTAVNAAGAGSTVPVRLVAGKENDRKTLDSLEMTLTAGESESVHWKLPFAEGGNGAARVAGEEFMDRQEEAAAFWEALLARGMGIDVPEPRVAAAHRAWLIYNFLNVDRKGGVYAPHDGSGFYEAIFGYSAALYCHALDLFGLHGAARAYLDSLLTFVTPEGLFVRNFGLPDTGALLFALGQHYKLTSDDAWLKRTAPVMIRMCDWILETRKRSMAEQDAGSAVYGLIKYRPYADDPRATYSYMTDTYLCIGLESAVEALAAAGMAGEAARLRAGSEAYRRDILDSMGRAVIERNGRRMLPVYPETRELLKRTGYTARDYYTLIAGCILETGFLPASSEFAGMITDLMEQREGLRLGMCRFDAWGWGGIDHAYTYGFWMNGLERNEVKRALLGFYGSLAYGMSRDTYSAVEVTRMLSGENAPTLPHLYSNTQQLRLLRNMLIREEGNALILGQAIPRPWLAGGRKVAVERAPTIFGEAGFCIEMNGDATKAMVHISPPERNPPGTIRLHLRHPRFARIDRVEAGGLRHPDFTEETITLTGASTPVRLEVGFEWK